VNTLVLNLTRFGDLLQTQPAISGLGDQGGRVSLVCLENFAGAASLLRGLCAVRPLPGASFLAACDRDWRLALAEVEDFARGVATDLAPDLVVNLTPSLPARILARRIPARERRGFLVDEYGFGQFENPWAAFLQLSSGGRAGSPFNVADLFRRAAGLSGAQGAGEGAALRQPDEAARREAQARLTAAAPPGTRGFVAFQPGASEDRRRWPMAHFQDLGRRLWEERGLCPVLLGSGAESPLGQRFEAGGPPCVNLVGATSLPELAAVLTRTLALVTNDTGTMHLAAGLGLPVLALFLATAQPWDTGPCRENALCLEPDLPCHPCAFGRACPSDLACRAAIRPEDVGALLAGFLDTGRWPPARGLSLRAWVTRPGGDGLMTLDSLSGHDQGDRGVWMRLLHAALAPFLDREEPAFPAGLGTLSGEAREGLSRVLAEAGGLLALAGQQARLLGMAPREALKAKFLATCRRVEQVLASDARTAALAALWACQTQEEARNMADLAALADRHARLAQALARGIAA
jgi:ADP-heptose:LPS heptosyltransferase